MNTSISKWYPVAAAGDIPDREGRKVKCGEKEVAVFNRGGQYSAIENVCPHKGGPLADGIVAGDAVFCPLHNWKISLGTGCAISGGSGQVKTFPVKVIQGKICVAFEEGKYGVLAEENPPVCEAKDL